MEILGIRFTYHVSSCLSDNQGAAAFKQIADLEERNTLRNRCGKRFGQARRHPLTLYGANLCNTS